MKPACCRRPALPGGEKPRFHQTIRRWGDTGRAFSGENRPVLELDTRGLACPLPLLKAKQALNKMASGEQLRVQATDPGSQRDFRVFAELSGHRLLASDERDGVFCYVLEKR
jgi:tRNA 2-thiouridine synthesizing protein A